MRINWFSTKTDKRRRGERKLHSPSWKSAPHGLLQSIHSIPPPPSPGRERSPYWMICTSPGPELLRIFFPNLHEDKFLMFFNFFPTFHLPKYLNKTNPQYLSLPGWIIWLCRSLHKLTCICSVQDFHFHCLNDWWIMYMCINHGIFISPLLKCTLLLFSPAWKSSSSSRWKNSIQTVDLSMDGQVPPTDVGGFPKCRPTVIQEYTCPYLPSPSHSSPKSPMLVHLTKSAQSAPVLLQGTSQRSFPRLAISNPDSSSSGSSTDHSILNSLPIWFIHRIYFPII